MEERDWNESQVKKRNMGLEQKSLMDVTWLENESRHQKNATKDPKMKIHLSFEWSMCYRTHEEVERHSWSQSERAHELEGAVDGNKGLQTEPRF